MISISIPCSFAGSEEADRRNLEPYDEGRNYDDGYNRYPDGGEYDQRSGTDGSGGYQRGYGN